MNNHTAILESRLSDAEFDEVCRRLNGMNLNLELTKEGTIRVMTPAGNKSSEANSEIIRQLRNWWHTHRQGRVFDSDTLFTLPDGSKLGPDAAYITAERLAGISREALDRFAAVAPSLVIELLSRTDSLTAAMEKMRDWVTNGVEVGWLIDPYQRHSYIFGQRTFTSSASALYGAGPVAGFTLDLTEVWAAYE